MKRYKLEIISKLDRLERTEALQEMHISTPEILDYLIDRHEKGISNGVNPNNFVTEKTIESWKEVLARLVEARRVFNQ